MSGQESISGLSSGRRSVWTWSLKAAYGQIVDFKAPTPNPCHGKCPSQAADAYCRSDSPLSGNHPIEPGKLRGSHRHAPRPVRLSGTRTKRPTVIDVGTGGHGTRSPNVGHPPGCRKGIATAVDFRLNCSRTRCAGRWAPRARHRRAMSRNCGNTEFIARFTNTSLRRLAMRWNVCA